MASSPGGRKIGRNTTGHQSQAKTLPCIVFREKSCPHWHVPMRHIPIFLKMWKGHHEPFCITPLGLGTGDSGLLLCGTKWGALQD